MRGLTQVECELVWVLGGERKSFKFFDLFVLGLKTGVIVEGFADRSGV